MNLRLTNRWTLGNKRSAWRDDNQNLALSLLGAAGLGAGLMYLLDPSRGSRRRAGLRDQCVRATHKTGDAIGTTSRDLSHRIQGLFSQFTSLFRSDEADDQVIEARVRSHLGRAISHPGAIEVRSENGHVTLSGPILAREVDELLSCVSHVSGVQSVENRLEVHQQTSDVAALQGGSVRASRSEFMQENWSPTARVLAGVGGGALLAYGLQRRDWLGAGLAICGGGLLARGATNIELARLTGLGGGRRAVEIQKTININAPVERVFEFWSNFENFPRFMSNVREVRDYGGGRSHWTVAVPAGVPVSWEAEITRMEPNRIIAWKSLPGSAIANAGIIHFDSVDGGTQVDVKLAYNPPAGAVGHAVASLFGADPKSELDADLMRMKTMIETGNVPYDAANPEASDVEAAPASRTARR